MSTNSLYSEYVIFHNDSAENFNSWANGGLNMFYKCFLLCLVNYIYCFEHSNVIFIKCVHYCIRESFLAFTLFFLS